jgi:hypothetical protein
VSTVARMRFFIGLENDYTKVRMYYMQYDEEGDIIMMIVLWSFVRVEIMKKLYIHFYIIRLDRTGRRINLVSYGK